MTAPAARRQNGAQETAEFDAVVVGAGFAGIYMLYKLRELGFSARVFEAGKSVGGTWFWNRYPGARCDVESLEYQYSFSDELQREWNWSERYATQPEILRYCEHVADRFNLWPDMQFETRVTAANWDDGRQRWAVETDRGDRVTAQHLVMATGCLSASRVPDYPGLESFKGNWYHTGRWPHEGVDFSGQRVAVIGTGSSAIQSIPRIAEQAAHLTVFQRTPNFSVPANNYPLDPEFREKFKDEFQEIRRKIERSGFGIAVEADALPTPAVEVPPEERWREYERRWEIGGFSLLVTYPDLIFNKEANDTAAEFVRAKIREIVKDPATAELLAPKDYPIGTKRLCVDTDYYETYNRDNVSLVDLRATPIEEITPAGLRTTEKEYEFDSIVFATGFDAMTGALMNIDIRGRGGLSLREKWEHGPRTYLGISVAGFPNMYTITGPGSPSVLSNMMVSIEQHVDWIADLVEYMREHESASIEATAEAEDAWVQHVNEVGDMTLYPQANSWYVGANIPGKPRVFMPYIGGVGPYREKCEQVAASGYEGFTLRPEHAPAAARA